MTYATKYDQFDNVEWVRHSVLVAVVRERDAAEARAVQAEEMAAMAFELCNEYADRLHLLTRAAAAAVEGDADGLARLRGLVEKDKVPNVLPDRGHDEIRSNSS